MRNKNHIVTLKSLAASDHYRAQVQLKNKWIWAVLYGAICETDQRTAGRLRDAFSERIEAATLSHTATLLGAGDFAPKLMEWVSTHVGDDALPFIMKQLRKSFPSIEFDEPQFKFRNRTTKF